MKRRFMMLLLALFLVVAAATHAVAALPAVDYGQFDRLESVIPVTNAKGMLARDGILYVLRSDALLTYDVGAPAQPVLRSSLPVASSLLARFTTVDSLLILSSSSRTYLYGIEDPLQPRLLADVAGSGPVARCGRFLLVGESATPRVYDLIDPAHPLAMAPLSVGGTMIGGWRGGVLTRRVERFDLHWDLTIEHRTVVDGVAVSDTAVVARWSYGSENSFDYYGFDGYTDCARYSWGLTRCLDYRCWEYEVYPQYSSLVPDDTGFRSAAHSLTESYPSRLRAANDQFAFLGLELQDCSVFCLRAVGRPGTASAGRVRTMLARTEGCTCADRQALYFTALDGIRAYSFTSAGIVDTLRIYTDDKFHGTTGRAQCGGRTAWSDRGSFCRLEFGPGGDRYMNTEFEYSVTVSSASANVPTFSRTILPTSAQAVLPWADDILIWSAGTVNFQRSGAAAPYATLPGLAATALAKVDSGVLAAVGTSLKLIAVDASGSPAGENSAGVLPFAVNRFETFAGGLVAAGTTGIAILTSADGLVWQSVATWDMGASVRDVRVEGAELSVAAGRGVWFYDLSAPAGPAASGSVLTPAYPRGSVASGAYLYIAAGDDGLLVYRRLPNGEAEYIGGYPLDKVTDVLIADGQLVIAAGQGYLALPLQLGDPLPSYAPDISCAWTDAGQVALSWPAPTDPDLYLCLERRCGSSVTRLPFFPDAGMLKAVDGEPGCDRPQYSLFVSGDGVTWSEIAATAPGPLPPRPLALTAFPNPFNPSVHLEYDLPRAGQGELAIFDLRGRQVRLLEGNAIVTSGHHAVEWDGRDDSGRPVGAGSYVARLTTEAGERSVKLILVR